MASPAPGLQQGCSDYTPDDDVNELKNYGLIIVVGSDGRLLWCPTTQFLVARICDDLPGSSSAAINKSITPASDGAKKFTFDEIALIANISIEEIKDNSCGKLFEGHLEGRKVVVKRHSSAPNHGEFLVEAFSLSHPNLVDIVGYCMDDDCQIIVYEDLPLGSLEDHLHGQGVGKHLDWTTRMRIAYGTAKALAHLHNEAKPPVIMNDLIPANILLGEAYYPKLSEFWLRRLKPDGSMPDMKKFTVYAPEYTRIGLGLTLETDVYGFGVLLLELITGKKSFDLKQDSKKVRLDKWAGPIIKKGDDYEMMKLVDSSLATPGMKNGIKGVMLLAGECVDEAWVKRPTAADIVARLGDIVDLYDGSHSSTEVGKQEDTVMTGTSLTLSGLNLADKPSPATEPPPDQQAPSPSSSSSGSETKKRKQQEELDPFASIHVLKKPKVEPESPVDSDDEIL